MKIENTGPMRPSNLKKTSALNQGRKGEFLSQLELEDVKAQEMTSSSPLAPLDTLFILQEISEEETSHKRAFKKATSLLERLEELRLALLEGRLSPHLLTQLQSLVKSESREGLDPEVKEILEEIELRASVELAKFHQKGTFPS